MNKLFYFLFRYPLLKIRLGRIGSRSWLVNPLINGHARIFIGSNVFIHDRTWLAAEPIGSSQECSLHIGDGSYIGRFCHFYATSKIEIGKRVLVADKVYIADNMHAYQDINLPVIDQPVLQTAAVIIGDGAWLGENACIVGANVGKNSVVGTNALVTKDVPDYCVVVGSPAYIIKRYNFETKQWSKTDKEGNFV